MMEPFDDEMYPDEVIYFRSTPLTGAMGGSKRTFPDPGTTFMASVQMGQPARTDANGRTYAATPTVVYTSENPHARADDKFEWTDKGGVLRILPVESATKSRGIGDVTWATQCKETI